MLASGNETFVEGPDLVEERGSREQAVQLDELRALTGCAGELGGRMVHSGIGLDEAPGRAGAFDVGVAAPGMDFPGAGRARQDDRRDQRRVGLARASLQRGQPARRHESVVVDEDHELGLHMAHAQIAGFVAGEERVTPHEGEVVALRELLDGTGHASRRAAVDHDQSVRGRGVGDQRGEHVGPGCVRFTGYHDDRARGVLDVHSARSGT